MMTSNGSRFTIKKELETQIKQIFAELEIFLLFLLR
jgi:hypothetical protein